MPLPKDYLFSPFVLRAQEDAKPKGRKVLSYYANGVEPAETMPVFGKSNTYTDYTNMYQNYMYNVTEAAKSFNYYKPISASSRPRFINDFYEGGGDVLDALDKYYDIEDGFNVAGAVMMDEARGRKRSAK